MKNKTKKFFLGFGVGVLTLGVFASFGSLLNNQNGWFDNLVGLEKYYMGFHADDLKTGFYTEDFTIGGITIHATEEKNIEVRSRYNNAVEHTFESYGFKFYSEVNLIGKSSYYYNEKDVESIFEFRCMTFELKKTSKVLVYKDGDFCSFVRYEYKNEKYVELEKNDLKYDQDSCFLKPGNYALISNDLSHLLAIEFYD